VSTVERRRTVFGKHVRFASESGLEIGPLDTPTVSKAEGNVKYLDYMTKEQLVARHGVARDAAKIITPDYVVRSAGISGQVHELFDYIVACHVIEHVPNMVNWLEELHGILKEGGHLLLAIPDKRYTFDILRTETTLAHILRDYVRGDERADFDHNSQGDVGGPTLSQHQQSNPVYRGGVFPRP
jgi:2-polyprenyl-3-methyl-5-hydroxy-6-metoxy-1,4-benzoquinol methylase